MVMASFRPNCTRGRRLRGKLGRVKTYRVAAAALAAALAAGCAAAVREEAARFPSAEARAPASLVATVVRPAGAGPFPAVVQLHGCGGVEAQSLRWARWLAKRGYLALIVDSFGPRQWPADCRSHPDEPPVSARFDDGIGALRYLRSRPDVVPDRIGAIGWSQGGVYAMALVNGPSLERARARGVSVPEPGFAAAVAVYPGGCKSLVRERAIRPLLVLIGEADDWTPAEDCVRMVEAMRGSGADVAIVTYPGAHHYFDVEGQRPEVLDTVENETKPSGYGATVAYQADAAADAYRRVEAFFGRHLRRR
jgi:dienelactone hydrolase